MAHFLGRRGGLIVAGVLFFVSSLGSAWPESWLGHLGSVLTPLINALLWFLNLFFEDAPYLKFGDVITNFIGHRLFGGMGIGLASMLAPMYIAEIAPPSKRGALVTYQQIAIVSGITMSYFVNYFIKKFGGDGDPNWVHDDGWRWMLRLLRDSGRPVRAAAVLRAGNAARPHAQGQGTRRRAKSSPSSPTRKKPRSSWRRSMPR